MRGKLSEMLKRRFEQGKASYTQAHIGIRLVYPRVEDFVVQDVRSLSGMRWSSGMQPGSGAK